METEAGLRLGVEPGLWRRAGRRGLPRMAGRSARGDPPAMQESQDTLVQSLGQEDLMEERMTTLLQYAHRKSQGQKEQGYSPCRVRKE